MISDAQFIQWLEDPRSDRCLLAEIEHSTGTLYASNRGYVSGPNDMPANIPYPAWLSGAPTLAESLSGTESPGTLELINDGALDEELTRAYAGWPLRLYLGDPSWPRNDFRIVLSATTQDISAPSLSRLSFKLRDRRESLAVVVDDALLPDNKPVPITLGQVFNREAALEDANTLLYRVHNGPINAISGVRDNGVPVIYTPNLSDGTFTLAAAPEGKITADVIGAGTATTAGLIEWLAAAAGLTASEIDSANMAAFPNTETVGWAGVGTAKCGDVMRDIAAAAGAAVLFSALGALQLYRLAEPTAPVLDLGADLIEDRGLTLSSIEPPLAGLKLGYARNFSPQNADAQAGSVSTTDRDRFETEYRWVTAENAGVSDDWPLAETPDIDTYFVDESAAQDEADRRAALRAVPRRIFSARALAPAWTLRPGDTIFVQYPRYGLNAGALAVVARKVTALSTLRLVLDLWL